MPYVITTHNERKAAMRTQQPAQGAPLRFRRAVATLEEAREHTYAIIHGVYSGVPFNSDGQRAHRWKIVDAQQLPTSGGTVGPLPDGTVIEVERREWIDIGREIGADSGDLCACPNAEIIDAYNARES